MNAVHGRVVQVGKEDEALEVSGHAVQVIDKPGRIRSLGPHPGRLVVDVGGAAEQTL